MSESIGSFQVLGKLGTGAHSTILHIRRNKDAKAYALKVVPIDGPEDQKFLEQAEHEFAVAQKLDHPNLIKIYCLEKVRALGFLGSVKEVRLLIEYVHGQTLDQFKLIPMPQLVQIFVRVASGLVMMHRRNIYHADLKPNNILVGHGDVVKVIDFGLAWIKGEAKDRVQGTPEYMAPEQVTKKIVNEATDIFNFGATMYRMVTWRNIPSLMAGAGSLSHSAATYERAYKKVLELSPATPPALAELIDQCLAYHPRQRPERVSEVQGTLDHLADELIRGPEDELANWEWEA